MKYTLLAAIGIGSVLVSYFTWNAYIESRIADYNEKHPASPELCEVQVANPDGTVRYSQDHPGETELLILATQNGIKIYAPCE